MNRLTIFVIVLAMLVIAGCQKETAEVAPPLDAAVTAAPTKAPAKVVAPKLVSPKPVPALPWWGDQNFPIIHDSKPMDPLQIMAFGLRPAVLTEEWVALNWYEDRGGFHLDTLPIGTIVLMDQAGCIQYKYDCSNRLVQPTTPGFGGWDWPSTSMVLSTTGPTTPLPTTTYRRLDNWFSRLLGRVGEFIE